MATKSTRVDAEVLDAVNQQRKERNQPLQAVIDHALKLWLALPVTVQAQILAGEATGSELLTLIRSIVDEKLKQRR